MSLLMKPLEKTSDATTVPDGFVAPFAYSRNSFELDPPRVARNARCGPPLPMASKFKNAATCFRNQGWSRTTPRAPMNPSSSAETNIATRGVSSESVRFDLSSASSEDAPLAASPCANARKVSRTIATLAALSHPPGETCTVSTCAEKSNARGGSSPTSSRALSSGWSSSDVVVAPLSPKIRTLAASASSRSYAMVCSRVSRTPGPRSANVPECRVRSTSTTTRPEDAARVSAATARSARSSVSNAACSASEPARRGASRDDANADARASEKTDAGASGPRGAGRARSWYSASAQAAATSARVATRSWRNRGSRVMTRVGAGRSARARASRCGGRGVVIFCRKDGGHIVACRNVRENSPPLLMAKRRAPRQRRARASHREETLQDATQTKRRRAQEKTYAAARSAGPLLEPSPRRDLNAHSQI